MSKSPFDDVKAHAGSQPDPSLSSQTGDPGGFPGWTSQGGPPLHPLMQHPTASVAAAAAVGFGMASHFAGFLLGAMQGFMEAAQKSAAVAERERQAADAPTASDAATSGTPVDAPETDANMAVEAKAAVDQAPSARVVSEPAATTTVAPFGEDASGKPAKVVKGRRGKSGDDLKRISGVGPKLEQVLLSMGVTRFKDVAAWTDEDILKFDAALGVSGRIVRDKWIEQAKTLAKG